MINGLLQFIAPHHCYGCYKIGYVLCQNCGYDIIDEAYDGCLVCLRPSPVGICSQCKTSYEKAWFVGNRDGVLEQVIDAYKFDRVKSAAKTLAILLHKRLPVLPDTTIVVPIPTIPSHVRQRGYDHTLLIVREFARIRKLKAENILLRAENSVQRGQSRGARFAQAKTAFHVKGSVSSVTPYLVIDDVVTTNATLHYACDSLRRAGAETVWVAAVAHQPLKEAN